MEHAVEPNHMPSSARPLNLSRMASKRLSAWAKDFLQYRAFAQPVILGDHVFPAHDTTSKQLALPTTLSLSDRDQVAVLLLEEGIQLTPSLIHDHGKAAVAGLAIKRKLLPIPIAPSTPLSPTHDESFPPYDEPPPPYSEGSPSNTVDSFSCTDEIKVRQPDLHRCVL